MGWQRYICLTWLVVLLSFCLLPVDGWTACTPAPSGMVSWWSGDNNALDLIGTNEGTLVNGATYAAGLVGQAFSFDGVNDYVNVPHNASLSFNSTGPMSFDLWVYRTSTSNGQHILSKRTGCGSDDMNYLLVYDRVFHNGLCFVGTDAGGNLICTTGGESDLPLNTWTHIAGTFDGNDLKLYINAELVGTKTNAVMGPVNAVPLTIGAMGGCVETYPFGGLVDELEIFNRTLTAEEIAAIYNAGSAGKCRPCAAPPSGLVSWWKAEGNAQDTWDGNHGSLQNGTVYGTGKVGQAFSFDGNNGYVFVPNTLNIHGGAEATYMAWVYPKATPAVVPILDFWGREIRPHRYGQPNNAGFCTGKRPILPPAWPSFILIAGQTTPNPPIKDGCPPMIIR